MSWPGEPSGFAVIPEFLVEPGCTDAFLALGQDDASRLLADEPDCRKFAIIQRERSLLHVLFSEVYDSPAAFEMHLRMLHLPWFREGFLALALEERLVRIASLHHG
jgi:quinol monooxygenase YgiN